MSHKPRPIKVVETALSVATKANKIAQETAKTGKVTAVVAVMSIFKRKKCKLRSAILRNERPSCQRAERANLLQEIPADRETFLKIQEKVGHQRN